MPRQVTINDLAAEAKVSVSTIDRIISGRGRVKATTLEHVLLVAERIGFYGASSIKSRIERDVPERAFGFVLNGRERKLYGNLAEDLKARVGRASDIKGRVVVRHLETIDAEATADALMELGGLCDAVAGICIDHPATSRAVSELARKGVPFISMLSDISSPERAGFVGSNDWQIGRTAGWFMQRLCPPGGKIAVLIGSERYLCQQAQESSFRSFMRSQEQRFGILETSVTDENDTEAERLTRKFIEENADLRGIFVAAGGMDGVIRALEAEDKTHLIVVGTEFTLNTHQHLSRGLIDMLLAHPVEKVVEHTIQSMISLTTQSHERGSRRSFSFRCSSAKTADEPKPFTFREHPHVETGRADRPSRKRHGGQRPGSVT